MKPTKFLAFFDKLDDVYSAYPSGVSEDSFVLIAGHVWVWDKYSQKWTKYLNNESQDADGVKKVYGDQHVYGNMTVAGVLRARVIRGRSAFAGYFASEEQLNVKYPNPYVGQLALVAIEGREVGDMSLGEVYACMEEGRWSDQNFTAGCDDGLLEVVQALDTVHEDLEQRFIQLQARFVDNNASKTVSFEGVTTEEITIQDSTYPGDVADGDIIWSTAHRTFVIRDTEGKFYSSWSGMESHKPTFDSAYAEKIYIFNGHLYAFNSSSRQLVDSTAAFDNAITEINGRIDDISGPGRVTEESIADGAVTENKIGNGAVTENKIGNGAVTENKIGNGVVTEEKIADGAVSLGKLASGITDEAPTSGSGKLITSGAVHRALANTAAVIDDAIADNKAHHTVKFGAIVEEHVEEFERQALLETPSNGVVVWCDADGVFALRVGTVNPIFYTSWPGVDLYMDATTDRPYTEKQYMYNNSIYMYNATETKLQQMGGSSQSSIFNVTNEVPIGRGYYTLCDTQNTGSSAVHAVWEARKAASGLIISFEIAQGIWKTFQYVGKNLNSESWYNPDNWNDFGSLAAGSEPYIIINSLCGAPTAGQYYTLQSAVTRLVAWQDTSGVNYAKKGLIISYQTGENTMETKQFQGEVTDFGEVGLWKDFGGGSNVETTDEPEEDSEKALSAGGAYNCIPAGFNADTETTPGVVKLQMVNAKGEPVGDEKQIPVGTGGGGGGTGTVVAIAFEASPFYGNAGGRFILKAAVRSVTTVGASEQDNTIATLDLYDRDTNIQLMHLTPNKASSASMRTFDFEIDVTEYFADAGVRRFRCVATDDSGNTGTRNVNVTAVDASVSSVQTLQYTQSTSLAVGGTAKTITLYKFANNSSDKGILAITEVYLNGEWQEYGRALVTDTYSHGISIDPNNCLGEVLTHGVLLCRVHGRDVAANVDGNYLYAGIFVIDESSTVPLIAESWKSELADAVVRLYDTIEVQYAVYDPTTTSPRATIMLDGHPTQQHVAYRSAAYTYRHQVTGVAADGSYTHIISVASGSEQGFAAGFLVSGSVMDAVLKDGAIYSFDFANRSNDELDHSIVSGGKTINVVGSNWNTTGFGTINGEHALRIAEDVTAQLDHKPFESTTIENNGLGLQFAFTARNLVDDDAVLMSCFNEGVGAGFYVTGRHVAIYCASGLSNHVEARSYKQGKKVTVGIVVEPAVQELGQTRNGTTYHFIKLYLDGEEVACIGYEPGRSNLNQNKPITFDGSQGDFYLHYMIAWDDYFLFDQAFQNYLAKLTNTDDMVVEYNNEQVMASQQVTEQGVSTTKLRPQAAELAARGMAYIIECPFNGSNIEALDNTTSTKDNNYVTLYYIDPKRPYTNFVATDVRRRNQGTTSAQRPVKNPRYYLAQKNGSTYNKSTKTGGTTIQLLNPDDTTEEGRRAIALAAINKVQIHDDSIPVDIITVKVDYSDSSNANDCGVCDMMNATFRSLGNNYITPAQRAFDGTWTKGDLVVTGLIMNHSTANIPCAMFRSKSDTGASPYFHAKGNWKEDKKEQVALGFNDVPGYNKGCLNYGDFIEVYGLENETLAQTKTRFLATSGLDTSATYVLSQYCGSSYKVMKYVEGQWQEQTGSMVQNSNGRWTVTGSVVNPVEGFELLSYQGMDWFKGVSSVADLMAPSTSFSKWVQALIDDGDVSAATVPAWTYYFESLVDDDDLAIAYALGKKVPYNLYRWMKFCDSCDYDKNGASGLNLWKTDLYKYASPHSMLAYDIFTDYLAAVDQRAKNMQPMWFLEDGCKVVNGVYYNAEEEANDSTTGMLAMRMYLNKVYDCDTCNGKDNDGGQTVDAEVDPNKMPEAGYTNPYAGYNSILFRNIYLQQTVYVDGNNTELSLRTVASAMRSCTATVDGRTLKPFSPEGAEYFFLTARIKRWQKKVSSYDGERKYIDFTPTANNIYFYALQGLGLTSLPAFIERRWRIRDGFYGTGDFFSGVLSGRVYAPAGAKITVKAAKTGYFGIGNDSADSVSETVYLEAGQSHEFTQFPHEEETSLFIYQADRMSKIDLSEVSLGPTFDFSKMTLVEEIYLGALGKTNYPLSYGNLTSPNFGELPFLKVLDIRGTIITNVVCTGCPRLRELYAAESTLTRADIADGAKIAFMQLPASYTDLRLRYLPDLEISGLYLADPAAIKTLIVENNAKIDSLTLLNSIANTTGSALERVRISTLNINGNGDDLSAWSTRGWHGFDATLTMQNKPALVGTYMLNRFVEEDVLAEWQSTFTDLTIHNAQFTMIEFDDTDSDPQNITNLENNTKGDNYTPSGHILAIRKRLIAVKGQLNTSTGEFDCVKVTGSEYGSGVGYDNNELADTLGNGDDAMMRFPHCWIKGINDFKNQKKYVAWSFLSHEPISTATRIIRRTLADIIKQTESALQVTDIVAGTSVLEGGGFISASTGNNVYSMDVEGMKQVRWPGLNHASVGACFLDEDGVIISKYNMAIANDMFDFVTGDYTYINVPEGAKTFVFTSSNENNDLEAIAVNSTHKEAIEPDWVEVNDFVGGIYPASVDSLRRLRSLSGATIRVGTGTSTTSSEWTYDDDGNPRVSSIPVNTMNYTQKDFQNLAMCRGAGYQLIDYEMSKLIALLFYSMTGNRDSSSVIGYGRSAGGTNGYANSIGNADSFNGQFQGNKALGFESILGCTYEWMTNVARNIKDYPTFMKNKCVGVGTDPVDAVWHIYDPITKTERTVKGITQSGNNIARLKNGRFCDVIASKCSSDTSVFSTYFGDGHFYQAQTGRVVGRAGGNAFASGGLVFAHASNASSSSYTSFGSRLAFRGKINIIENE